MPLIYSDIPENSEILEDDALHFKNGVAHDLAERIRWALDNPDATARLAARAKERMSRQYSWDNIASDYDALYRELGTKDASKVETVVQQH